MVEYFYAWTPLVIVGTLCILALPWLGLVALVVAVLVALVVLAALAWAIVYVPYMLTRAIGRRWHSRSGASLRTAPALAPAAPTRTAPQWASATAVQTTNSSRW